jgi:quercetin dioxygenase-like cupin family protein
MTAPVIVEDVRTLALRSSVQPAYDRPFDLQALYVDPRSGAEHYVIHYPAGTKAKWHRHSAAHTMIVVAGELVANGEHLGVGGYAHFPGGTEMLHEPAANHDCTFVLIFDGPFDLELMGPGGDGA